LTVLPLHFGHLIFPFTYSEMDRIKVKGFLHFSQTNSYVGMVPSFISCELIRIDEFVKSPNMPFLSFPRKSAAADFFK
jgi:hypothetical protein